MAKSRLISCDAVGFDCETSSISGGKFEPTTRKKFMLGGSVGLACGASVMLGFFVLGPVLQNVINDSKAADYNHKQTLGKFAFSNVRSSSRPLRPMTTSGVEPAVRAADPVMVFGNENAAPKKVAKEAASKHVVPTSGAPRQAAKNAAPKRVAWNLATRKFEARGSTRSSIRMMAEESEAARREKLAQLFGENSATKIAERTSGAKQLPKDSAAKIAERTGGVKQLPKDEAETYDIKMLMAGMQRLEWGQIRLIDVSMAPGPLLISVAPLLSDSTLLSCRLDMPLGMVLEESEDDDLGGAMVVSELLDEGAAKTGGVMVGDLLRATTAVTMQMSYPFGLMLPDFGQPKRQKILFGTQGETFETVMAALGSNTREQQGNGQLVLVLERPKAK